MAAPTRDQVLSLLAAANNHGDLAVKTSSLKQAKDLLLSIDPSLAADLFPYLLELQSSPESLVRKLLIQLVPTSVLFFFPIFFLFIGSLNLMWLRFFSCLCFFFFSNWQLVISRVGSDEEDEEDEYELEFKQTTRRAES